MRRLENTQVHTGEAGAYQNVAAGIAVETGGRQDKSGRIKIPVGAAENNAAERPARHQVGTVRDMQGVVIPNASVPAKNLGTGAQRTALSDASGGFNIVSVPAGS